MSIHSRHNDFMSNMRIDLDDLHPGRGFIHLLETLRCASSVECEKLYNTYGRFCGRHLARAKAEKWIEEAEQAIKDLK